MGRDEYTRKNLQHSALQTTIPSIDVPGSVTSAAPPAGADFARLHGHSSVNPSTQISAKTHLSDFQEVHMCPGGRNVGKSLDGFDG